MAFDSKIQCTTVQTIPGIGKKFIDASQNHWLSRVYAINRRCKNTRQSIDKSLPYAWHIIHATLFFVKLTFLRIFGVTVGTETTCIDVYLHLIIPEMN